MIRPPKRECNGTMVPGEDLVVAGYICQRGTRELIQAFRQELFQWFSKSFLWEAVQAAQPDVNHYLPKFMELGATESEPAGEGGILKAIWDLSGAYRVGLTFFPRTIPIRQCTIEICERVGCNPYRLFLWKLPCNGSGKRRTACGSLHKSWHSGCGYWPGRRRNGQENPAWGGNRVFGTSGRG